MDKVEDGKHSLTASEALFGFMGWLTSFEKPITFSAHHGASPAVDLVAMFCKANNLDEVSREDWYKFIKQPDCEWLARKAGDRS